MQLEKPKISRARVVVYDPETGKSQCRTYYHATAEVVWRALDNVAQRTNPDRPRKRREPQPA